MFYDIKASAEKRKIDLETVRDVARHVFVPFTVYYMRQPLKLDYLWAALCIVGAVYFVFRAPATP